MPGASPHPGGESSLHSWADHRWTVLVRAEDGLHGIPNCGLDLEHHRGVPERGVGSQEQVELREARHRDAQVGRSPGGDPLRAKSVAGDASDAHPIEAAARVKSGCQDQRIEVVFGPGDGRDARRVDAGDGVGLQRDIGSGEGRPVVI